MYNPSAISMKGLSKIYKNTHTSKWIKSNTGKKIKQTPWTKYYKCILILILYTRIYDINYYYYNYYYYYYRYPWQMQLINLLLLFSSNLSLKWLYRKQKPKSLINKRCNPHKRYTQTRFWNWNIIKSYLTNIDCIIQQFSYFFLIFIRKDGVVNENNTYATCSNN